MTREEIFRAALESGLQRVESCCGVDGKLCESDVWRGNLEGFVAAILRRAGVKPGPESEYPLPARRCVRCGAAMGHSRLTGYFCHRGCSQ